MIDVSQLRVRAGRARPFGATPEDSGVQFTIFSRHAVNVWLALFDDPAATEPAWEFRFDPLQHRLGDVWTIFVEGVGPGALYLYRLNGPNRPELGHRFKPSQFLLDPYARAITGDPGARSAKCVVIEPGEGWANDTRPRIPMSETIIYEAHLKGMTAHPSAGVERPGTYRALIEKIPYLKDLGITSVELLPIHVCGERTLPRKNGSTGEPLTNYWGYSPIGFFAPDERYASLQIPGAATAEFREMVAAFHAAGLEVIIDVVYNHTSEKDGAEPAQSFRGIDNSIYYLLDERGRDRDLTGCGNTVRCNHPVVRDLILDSLRYWVTDMHVDGFRFDLASVLRRDRWGHMQHEGPLIEQITEDPILREVKLIAEPWDLAGGYLVGAFGGEAWAEWNARYRDDVRRFWRGDKGSKGDFALRITGSQDLYGDDGRTPLHSINFVTAHDGFTLRDLVSYNTKHNEANGEDNRDGLNENFSWNCGVEGETDDAAVNTLRLRMQKNYLATLFLSLGVPMLLAGDEFGRTQRGNNNAYCQDNEISWLDWTMLETNRELFRFCRGVIEFRKENPVFSRRTYFTGKPAKRGAREDLLWYCAEGKAQTWSPDDMSLACLINGSENGGVDIYLVFNPSLEVLTFKLPELVWRVRINTENAAPHDLADAMSAPRILPGSSIVAKPKTMIVLTHHPER